MNLYEIRQEIANAIESCIDMETGEIINPERLNELTVAHDEKREGVALFIKNKIAEIEAIDKELKTLSSRKKSLSNRVEWLKSYLSEDLAGHKFETGKVLVTFRKSEVLEVNSTESIPQEYLIAQPPKVDKASLKKVVKTGAVFNGVSLIVKNNIQIK